MPRSAWTLYHPVVPIVYLLAVLVLAMAFMHPVLAGLSLTAALLYSFLLAGWRSTLKMLAWQVPLLLVVALANLVFSASGSTVLFQVGLRSFYLEALVYGFASGCMLLAVMTWFSNGNRILDSDQVLLVGARKLPVVSLMASMVLRLVPQFLRRGGQISDAQLACTAAGVKRGSVAHAARTSTVLMSWAMEDSLEEADAMRCRGWGSGDRSSYETRRLRGRDAVLLAVVALLACIAFAGCLSITASFAFYPVVAGFGSWYLYAPYVVLLALPICLEFEEWFRWR